jgi:carbon-monoxide dehydrogenase small subunit
MGRGRAAAGAECSVSYELRFRLNGETRSVEVEPSDILLDVLREKLGVKSPKIGCERGDCGACTVLLDGKSVRTCLILAIEVDGCEITTVEGLSRAGLTPVQQSFLEHDSFQCGFCAPGIVLSATELLGKNPHPSEAEVKEVIAGNLCRCTGYKPIIEAILALELSTAGETDPSPRPSPLQKGRGGIIGSSLANQGSGAGGKSV